MRDDTIELTEDGLPAVFTVGTRMYRIHRFLKKGDNNWVSGLIMRDIAVKIGAVISEEDFDYISKRQDELPQQYRSKISLAFPHQSELDSIVKYLVWGGDKWYRYAHWLGSRYWRYYHCLVSRVK